MPIPLLSTKLYIPPTRANYVARPRLTERLLAGLNCQDSIVFLSGPAGIGKTTLLSECVAQLRQPVAWVSLDEGDNDPIRFWTYLIAACQSVLQGVGESALTLFHTPQSLPVEAVPTILINDFTRLDRDLVLVLDDYHTIQNKAIQESFTFLLEHLPEKFHIVVSTRVDPAWPLARFRARNRLVEVRVQDLRFTIEEAASFLNQKMELNLSTEDVTALEERTEGWVAGLQLAALAIASQTRSSKGGSDIAAFVKAFSGSHVYIAEYLVEEVLQRQPEDMQLFLLRTSILERLNAGLCESITGCGDSQARLAALQRANLFVMPLDDEGRWFRYHHLFADLLKARLQQSRPADEIDGLHRRAAAWYAQNGFAVEAVSHALVARDFDQAARLVEQFAYPLMTRGELATCMQWMGAFSEAETRQRPLFLLAKAWALTFAGSFQKVEPLLQQVEALLQKEPDTPAGREMLGSVYAMRAFFAMLAGAYARALELAERAESLSPETNTGARSLLPYTLGVALRGQGHYEKAAEAFARDVQMGERFDDLLIWATGITELVNTRRMQGRLREAVRTGRQALQRLVERGAVQFGSLAKIEVALCEVLRELNELDEAKMRVLGTIDRMQAWDMPTDRLFAYLVLARIQESQGDFDGVRESLQTARELRDAYPVLMNLARAVDMYEIRLRLATRNVTAAERLLGSLRPGTSRVLVLREQELTMLARFRLAHGHPDEAFDILSSLAEDPLISERLSTWLEILVLQACCLYFQSDQKAAVSILLKALALAEPEGFVRVFVDEGEVMQQLLVAAEHQIAADTDQVLTRLKVYVAKLLTAFGGSKTPDLPPGSIVEQAALVEPLTKRELEVLQCIACGDSNRMIAEKLVITVSAVKKHTSNIFGKLNVNSRTQAVACARQLRLLPLEG